MVLRRFMPSGPRSTVFEELADWVKSTSREWTFASTPRFICTNDDSNDSNDFNTDSNNADTDHTNMK